VTERLLWRSIPGGAEDRIVRPSAAQEFTHVRGAEIVMIPGAGHSPHVETPDETAAIITDFAARIRKEG
jgi:pimeloyl-ACP methyl ester carboxylesterase